MDLENLPSPAEHVVREVRIGGGSKPANPQSTLPPDGIEQLAADWPSPVLGLQDLIQGVLKAMRCQNVGEGLGRLLGTGLVQDSFHSRATTLDRRHVLDRHQGVGQYGVGHEAPHVL